MLFLIKERRDVCMVFRFSNRIFFPFKCTELSDSFTSKQNPVFSEENVDVPLIGKKSSFVYIRSFKPIRLEAA